MNTAYPLLPVSLILFLAYFTTRIFTGWNILSIKTHRKFWNYILLIAFLGSALLGLLSVVKVNYKLDIPGYENYLQWHVSFGIALAFIAIIHLSWHLNYYFSFTRPTDKNIPSLTKTIPASSHQFRVLLFLLGTIAIISQIIFIREFISVLAGNELIVGIIMACWMLLTGWGALHARKGNFNHFSLKQGIHMLAGLAIFPLVLIVLLNLLKNLLFPPGTLINIGSSLAASFLLLFPVCFLSGYLFTLFSTFLSLSKNSNLTGRAYSTESLGSLAGGLLFTLLLGRLFNSLQIIGISTAVIYLAGSWLLWEKKRRTALGMFSAGLLIPTLIFIFNPDAFLKKLSFPNQELISTQSTRYGNLVISRQAGQVNVYENNNLQFYTENVIMNEEAVHFAMVQHENPEQVLLISGGIAGMIQEILKYEVNKITYLESNPEIFRIPGKYTEPLPDSGKVEIIKKDIRSYIGRTGHSYDLILINLPPPASLGFNRFYTQEFFSLLKKSCKKGTVICTGLPSTANYAEKNALEANSSLWKTLGLFWENRLLITGEKNYFLASDSPLFQNITEKIEEKNIPTEYVNAYFVDDRLLAMRSESLSSRFLDSVPVNRDFFPFLFVKEIGHWLSYFGVRYHLMVLVPVLLFLFLFLRTDRITAGLYTGGFTAASLEVTLLLAYQVYFGSIYLATALFFAVFMGGLAFGSSLRYRLIQPPLKTYWMLQFGLALFAILLPILIQSEKSFHWIWASQLLFFALIFLLAAAVGFEFLLASRLREKSYSETSGVNYSTDLAGSALGAFLAAIVLLPMLGLVKTCLVVAGLNMVSGILALTVKKTSIA